MENSSFPGLNLLKKPLQSVLPLEGHFGIYEPLPQAILKPEIHVDICGPTKAGSHVDVPGPSYHQRPRMVWGAT